MKKDKVCEFLKVKKDAEIGSKMEESQLRGYNEVSA